MDQQIQAVYEGGVFRPLEPLVLPEQARVVLNVSSTAVNPDTEISEDAFNRRLAELCMAGPTLPTDFTRADIYAEHD
jgi:predicted DNA-binding antitoxin AbrB/MazE fold protein